MRVYRASSEFPYRAVATNLKYPCLTLSHDVWDDYGYKSVFHARYFPTPQKEHYLGRIKVLHRGHTTPQIPIAAGKLGDDFCSLGESIEYYEKLNDLTTATRTAVLDSLRDAAVHPDIAEEFESEVGWRGSLLRYSEAEKAFREARAILGLGGTTDRVFSFRFTTRVPGAAKDHEVFLDFAPDEAGLHRVAALIGRNGTGKTQFLGNFAHAMSGRNRNKGVFTDSRRPSFNRIIAVSYSVFDQFEKPIATDETFSYRYCGIWEVPKPSEEGAEPPPPRLLSPEEMWNRANESVRRILSKQRRAKWEQILSELLGETIPLERLILEDCLDQSFYHRLSSGQRILTLIMTELVSHIERDSLILFDEPELHLHPDVLSALARALHMLLDEYESFAILATHSPIVLQEIPSKHVRVFWRVEDVPSVRELSIESFGENLSMITDDIFGTTNTRNNYREILERLYKKHGFDGVMRLFEGRLGFNARAFLAALEPPSNVADEGEWEDEATWQGAE